MRRSVAAVLLCATAASAAAQSVYPERPIRLVVPFPAGGTVDAIARLVAQRITDPLKQPVVVDNRAGGAGSIGSEAVAKAPPDGYTLLMGTASTHGSNPSVHKALPYDPVRDYAPVALVASTPYIVVVHPSVAAASMAELVALAKAQPAKMNYGSYGSGSSNHLATELLRAITATDLVHVPYKGGAPAMTALLAGEVQLMLDVFPTSDPHVRAGKLKLLGVAASKRSSLAPNAPTLAEAGIAGAEAGTFFGVFAPAATPRAIVDRLNAEINRAIENALTRERMLALGAEPAGGAPDVLGQQVSAEVAKWAKLVRERNLRFEN